MIKLEEAQNKIFGIFESEWFKYALVFITLFFSTSIELVADIAVIRNIKNAYFLIIPLALIIHMIRKKQINKDINMIFLGLCIFSGLSLTWSISIVDTAKNALLLTGTTIIGVYMSKNYDKKEIMEKLFMWFFVIVVINLILFVLGVNTIYETSDLRYKNAIQGIFTHRNILGLYMSIAISLSLWFLINHENNKVKKILSAITLLGAMFLLFESRSMTSMLLGVFIIGLILITRYRKINKLLCYSVLPLMAFAIVILLFTPDWFKSILESLGRNPTLTGRSIIWTGIIAAIAYKPLFGFGFGAFWTMNPYSVLFVLSEYKIELPSHGHNGYLDVVLDFGIIGLILVAAWVITVLKKINTLSSKEINSNYKYIGYILSFFIFILVFNLVESSLIRQCTATYILVIIFTNMLFQISKEKEVS